MMPTHILIIGRACHFVGKEGECFSIAGFKLQFQTQDANSISKPQRPDRQSLGRNTNPPISNCNKLKNLTTQPLLPPENFRLLY